MSDGLSAHAHAGSNGGKVFLTGVGGAVVGFLLVIAAIVVFFVLAPPFIDFLQQISTYQRAPVVQQVQVQPLSYQTTTVAPVQTGSLLAPPQQIQAGGQTYNFQGIEETHDQVPCPRGQVVQGPDGYPRMCLGQR